MRVTIIVFVSVANVKIIDIKCDLGPNDDNDDECCLLEYVWGEGELNYVKIITNMLQGEFIFIKWFLNNFQEF